MAPWKKALSAVDDEESDEEERLRPATFETERQRPSKRDPEADEWWRWIVSFHLSCQEV
jgi:hypothetical protein